MQIDLSQLSGDTRAAFQARRQIRESAAIHRALLNQREIARTMGTHRSLEGIGGATMAVDPLIHAAWERKEGVGIWSDRSFRRRMKREFPELRVQSIGTKIQVGWTGPGPSEQGWTRRGPRFVKVYR